MSRRARHRARRGWLATGVAVLRALLVGVATVLVPKADAAAHWSTPPLVVVHAVVDAGGNDERS